MGIFIVSFVVASYGSEGQLQYVFAWILRFTYRLKNTILNDENNLKIISNSVYWSICLCLYFHTENIYLYSYIEKNSKINFTLSHTL